MHIDIAHRAGLGTCAELTSQLAVGGERHERVIIVSKPNYSHRIAYFLCAFTGSRWRGNLQPKQVRRYERTSIPHHNTRCELMFSLSLFDESSGLLNSQLGDTQLFESSPVTQSVECDLHLRSSPPDDGDDDDDIVEAPQQSGRKRQLSSSSTSES